MKFLGVFIPSPHTPENEKALTEAIWSLGLVTPAATQSQWTSIAADRDAEDDNYFMADMDNNERQQEQEEEEENNKEQRRRDFRPILLVSDSEDKEEDPAEVQTR